MLAAVAVSVVSYPVAVTMLGYGPASPRHPRPVVVLAIGLVILGLQLRHSMAAARGNRPRGGLWTWCALATLVYVPMIPFGYFQWFVSQALVVASAPMVLRGRYGFVVSAVVATVATVLTMLVYVHGEPGLSAARLGYPVLIWSSLVAALGGFVYGATRLVRVLEDLRATRAELAELAAEREQLRSVRDLHDLVGQSLAAIAFKGDLAIRLLHSDTTAARAEVDGLTAAARTALRGVLAIARTKHDVSLAAELAGADALLTAAGMDVRTHVDLRDLPRQINETMAWAVREGVTNVLHHSHARTCSIRAAESDGTVSLEIVNDGASRTPVDQGHGIAGLIERAKLLSGTVTTSQSNDVFRLLIRIPRRGPAT
jgi:two-component system, NarL family, sensor histidine kinase DesK